MKKAYSLMGAFMITTILFAQDTVNLSLSSPVDSNINAGANGFLSKLSEESEIRQAISELMEKGEYYSPLTQKLLKISAHNPDILNPLNQLSERELQIAVLYSKGYGNLEIANSLSLKQNTVSTFKKRIFEKLDIESLIDLINLMEIHHNI